MAEGNGNEPGDVSPLPWFQCEPGCRDAVLSLCGGHVGSWRAALVGFVRSSEILQPCKVKGGWPRKGRSLQWGMQRGEPEVLALPWVKK